MGLHEAALLDVRAVLTPAVVLLTSGGVGKIFDADLNRVAFTVAAAAASAAVLTAGRWLIARVPNEATVTR